MSEIYDQTSLELDSILYPVAHLAHEIGDQALEAYCFLKLGEYLHYSGQILKAIDTYENALQKYKEFEAESSESNHELVLVLNNLGVLYQQIRNPSKAEKVWLEALQRYKASRTGLQEDTSHYVAVLDNLANLYLDNGEYFKAEKMLKKALKIRRSNFQEDASRHSLEIAATLNDLGVICSKIDRSYRAEVLYREALSFYEKSQDAAGIAMVLSNLGNLYTDMDRLSQARTHLKKALKMRRTLVMENHHEYDSDLAETLNNLAILYKKMMKFKESEKKFQDALEICEKLVQEDPETYTPFLAEILNNLGGLYFEAEKYALAEKMYLESLRKHRELVKRISGIYDSDLAMVLNNTGLFYSAVGKLIKAEEAFKEALTKYRNLAQEYPDVYEFYVATTLNNLGTLYSLRENPKKSVKYYKKTLRKYKKLARRIPDKYDSYVALAFQNLGIIYFQLGRLTQAEKAYGEALTIRRRLAQNNPDKYLPQIAKTLNNLGNLYSKLDKSAQAEEAYNEAIQIRKDRGYLFELAQTYFNFSSISPSKIKKAVQCLELGVLLSGEQKFTYAQKGKRESLYLEYLRRADARKAFGVMEALRNSFLLSLDWPGRICENRRKYSQTNVGKLLKKDIPPLSIPQIAGLDDFVFLYIQRVEESIFYLMITEEDVSLHKGCYEFASIGRKLYKNLCFQAFLKSHDKDPADLVADFEHLSEKWAHELPSQIDDAISRKKTIIVSPDGFTSSFPLEGLQIDNVPICLSKAVVRATSVHQLIERASKKVDISSGLVVGNPWPPINRTSITYSHPEPIGPLHMLKGAVTEAQRVSEILPHSEILLGSQATAEAFLKKISQFSVIHFAGHGGLGSMLFFVGPKRRDSPGFESEELSIIKKTWREEKGKTAYLVEEWDPVTDTDLLAYPLKEGAFVFLNACETGKQKYLGGGHFQGLAQALLRNGASHVVSSLIPLFDESSADFAEFFYEKMLSGKSVTESLLCARKTTRKKYEAHVHWLPYIHYGFP
ncbi:MAG: CHAT domain-containing tetratricopeptide repeat protein [Candidatus Methanofastidiosia archaeon]